LAGIGCQTLPFFAFLGRSFFSFFPFFFLLCRLSLLDTSNSNFEIWFRVRVALFRFDQETAVVPFAILFNHERVM